MDGWHIMGIENFKRWHWIAISVVVGTILVFTQLYTIDGQRVMPGDGVNYRRTIAPMQFVRNIQTKTDKGYLLVRNATIYPPVQVQDERGKPITKSYVCGEEWEFQPSGKALAKPFQFYADVPFKLPLAKAAPRADYTIRDYLDEL